MKYIHRKEAILVLEDGLIMKGLALGAIGTSFGEICFNTGMTGYQEIYTDPSYFGQIIINTTPHIGNYGALDVEQESFGTQFAGLVCNDYSDIASRSNMTSTLQDYLLRSNVVGISGIDTRKLVRHIRSKGAMNAVISTEILDEVALSQKLKEIPSMEGMELSSKISTDKVYSIGSDAAKYKVAVLDLGVKKSIVENLASRDVYCKVFPAKTSFQELKAWNPDGYFISNGPGDPSTMSYAIDTVKDILAENAPLFGICLGHQLLALANGIPTYKMHLGHRGLNHPVKNLLTGHSEITSQNHGFSVIKEDVLKSDLVHVTHINLNDDTIEGISIKGKKAFSVQYHPEASPGPHDSRYLFDDFVKFLN